MLKSFTLNLVILSVIGTIGRCATLPADLDLDGSEDPQADGTVRWMDKRQAFANVSATKPPTNSSSKKLDKVSFFLYTQSNPTKPVELDMKVKESITRSPFNNSNPTRIWIHGWTDMYNRSRSFVIREALLMNGLKREYNFISADWSVYGSTLDYVEAKSGCNKAGRDIARFLDWMHDNADLSLKSVTLMGHSLGAHVAGFTGKHMRRGKIGSIIGLDPTMPFFQYNAPWARLAATDALYVESIQTNGGMKGYIQPIGQITFYPNGGKLQPGCGVDLTGACAHTRSISLFAESLRMMENNQLLGIGCSQFQQLRNGSCDLYSNVARIGDPNNANRKKGIYYLKTNSRYPFGIGLEAYMKDKKSE